MAETNGNQNTRLDRIEKVLEMFIADHERIRQDHEQFRQDHKQLLIAQVIQSEQIDKLLKVTQEHSRQIESERAERKEMDAALDTRISDLVMAIGNLIARIPPTALA